MMMMTAEYVYVFTETYTRLKWIDQRPIQFQLDEYCFVAKLYRPLLTHNVLVDDGSLFSTCLMLGRVHFRMTKSVCA